MVDLDLGYYQTTETSPGLVVAVSVPAGTTLLGCGALSYPDMVSKCTASPNTSLGDTVFQGNLVIPGYYCDNSVRPCLFEATLYVTFGSTPGTFQVEFEVGGPTKATVAADSVMWVVQAG